MTEWIALSEQLPEEDERCLTYNEDGWIDLLRYCWNSSIGYHFVSDRSDDYGSGTITHWMPLPKVP